MEHALHPSFDGADATARHQVDGLRWKVGTSGPQYAGVGIEIVAGEALPPEGLPREGLPREGLPREGLPTRGGAT